MAKKFMQMCSELIKRALGTSVMPQIHFDVWFTMALNLKGKASSTALER